MGNTPTNDNNDDNGFSEEPDDIFEPRTSINEGEVENLSARTRALLSLSDGKSRSFDEFSFGESGKKLLVGTQFLTGAQDECEEGSQFVESVFEWKPAVLWVN